MADDLKLEVKVTMAWWFRIYSTLLTAVAWMSGREPEWDKFQAMTIKAMRVQCGPARQRNTIETSDSDKG